MPAQSKRTCINSVQRSNALTSQAFVKFFGRADSRSLRDRSIADLVATSGSHRICTYPRNRRPRQVRDGDAMFMGQLVRRPDDIVVYGRAVARAYEAGPRQSIRQAAAIRLSEAGASWLVAELEGAFRRHGRLRAEEMPGLDWD